MLPRVGLMLLALGLASSHAQAQQRLRGFGPDAQLLGGGGFGLGGGLDNHFIGRLRIGALYALEPWLFNLGATVEVGALAELGLGGELEGSAFNGLFAGLGVARIHDGIVMGHLSAGFMLFGLEWQHAFAGQSPRDALLFEVRIPLGTWWLMRKKDARPSGRTQRESPTSQPGSQPSATATGEPATQAAPLTPAAAARPLTPLPITPQPLIARPLGPVDRQVNATTPAPAPTPEQLASRVESELALGRLAAAIGALRELIDRTPSEQTAERERLQARLIALSQRTPKLRLILGNARGDEQVAVDDVPQATAAAGYDVPLDPGEHSVQVTRSGRLLATRMFSAHEGQLVRIELQLP